MRSFVSFVLAVSASAFAAGVGGASAPAVPVVAWAWPVLGPVIQPFDPPDTPYGSGHRGIDIAAPVGTLIAAPADGVVTFAGPVGGRLFLTIDHGGGLESTYSWLSTTLVRSGARVMRGQSIATTGWGHPSAPIPHLHFGVRLLDVYVDPLDYLAAASVAGSIRLVPVS
jgi:murein DD-endopeptidase MepM/ murein hydrolase activator NlpD